MVALTPGTTLDAGGLLLPGVRPGEPLRIERSLGTSPHGETAAARIGAVMVHLTLFERGLVQGADLIVLQREFARIADIQHKNLLPFLGLLSGESAGIVRAAPGGGPIRTLLEQRRARSKPVDLKTAFMLCIHLCNAVEALHQQGIVHGYINVDTVFVTPEGRVLLSGTGEGPWVRFGTAFEAMVNARRLPTFAPEQMHGGMLAGTDVFAIAALLIDVLSLDPMLTPGQALTALSSSQSDDLLLCLERATAPDVNARPPDIAAFRDELHDAVRPRPATTTSITRSLPPLPPQDLITTGSTLAMLRSEPPPPPPSGTRPAVSADRGSDDADFGLGWTSGEDLAERLATLDGQADEAAFHGAVAGTIEIATAGGRPVVTRSSSAAPRGDANQASTSYLLTRNGIDHGPYSIDQLSDMIRAGNLRSVDTLRDRTTGQPTLVVDIPPLRVICERQIQGTAAPAVSAAVIPRAPAPPRAPRFVTLLWVLGVLLGFAAVGWVILQRAQPH